MQTSNRPPIEPRPAPRERLKSISGTEPTPGSIARFNKRVHEAFLTMGTPNPDDPQAAAKMLALAQKRVAPPSLPIIGHGTQLANIRLNAIFDANGGPPAPQTTFSRQVVRRNRLKAQKRLRAAEKKHAIANRRQKAKRAS